MKKYPRTVPKGERIPPNLEAPENPFFGHYIVVTGKFKGYEDREVNIQQRLAYLGADAYGNVTHNTSLVLIGHAPGKTKINEMEKRLAAGQKIEIIEEYSAIKLFQKFFHLADAIASEQHQLSQDQAPSPQ